MKSVKRIFCISLAAIFLLIFSVSVFGAVSPERAYTPVSAEYTSLKWAARLGASYRDAPSVPADAGDYLAVMSGKKLIKLSKSDGSAVGEASLGASVGYACVHPLYLDGTVYCQLTGGVIEAYDFSSMKRLWTYTDALGGQALTEIAYDGGYIYTGFWNDEDEDASYVCVDAESGDEVWSFTHKGGFYWAGCAIVGDYIVFGGDDGTLYSDRDSEFFMLDKRTGELLDTLPVIGDIRSGAAYCENNGRVYFVTKAGYIYSAKIADGAFSDFKSAYLGGASTSTPTVSGGRVYVGVSTSSGGRVSVIDSDSLSIIYSLGAPGYPQGEMLVNEEYGDMRYVYFTYNSSTGGIAVLADGGDNASSEVSELFIPDENMRGYCISPVIGSVDGVIYYKNDSGYIFALENTADYAGFIKIIQDIFAWLLTFINMFNKIFA